MSGKRRSGDKAPIIIKREEVSGGGHHGGAWKVAYADFVTAMMAFFLLMWLLNATTEAQRKGLADYFSPNATLVHTMSGAGLPFGGRTPFSNGEMASDSGAASANPSRVVAPPDTEEEETDSSIPDVPPNQAHNAGLENGTATGNAVTNGKQAGPQAPGGGPAMQQAAAPQSKPSTAQLVRGDNAQARTAELVRSEQVKAEHTAFDNAAAQIREAVRADPALAELGPQLAIDLTPEGLRIQILDEEQKPMFASGSSTLQDRARMLLQKVAPVLAKLSEPISIAGHTDSTPFHGTDKTNWELSAERANATRRLLVDAGVPDTRFRSVTGNADRDPLLPADPTAAANRRIAIVVLRTERKP